jgi:hypothetical protein
LQPEEICIIAFNVDEKFLIFIEKGSKRLYFLSCLIQVLLEISKKEGVQKKQLSLNKLIFIHP